MREANSDLDTYYTTTTDPYGNCNHNTHTDGYCYTYDHTECNADSYSYPYTQTNAYLQAQHNTKGTAHPAAAPLAFAYEKETHCTIRTCPPVCSRKLSE